jgi:hypothetical protein
VGKNYPQTVTILNEYAAVQAGYEQQVKKHHAESNPIVCPSDVVCRNIDTSPIYISILLEEAALATYQAPVLVLVVQYFIPRDEAG